ncbi:MAG: hypothetical protein Q7I94_03695 [Candidatus Contubernalis sp.]|nr:hypothetical protein [Candidatus Contubernalis sp.]
MKVLDAYKLSYRELNDIIKEEAPREKEIKIKNLRGHRFIGGTLNEGCTLFLEGIPGNDMGSFMNGAHIVVSGNAQDSVGNTMNKGEIVIHGHAGDIMGYAMRGGEIYVKNEVGYRVGIHMKEFGDQIPELIIGGSAGNFLGEYMAGGVIIVLGIGYSPEESIGSFCGTGMHGGRIYLRGEIPSFKFGKEVKEVALEEEDYSLLERKIKKYCRYFDYPYQEINLEDFHKFVPKGSRPYENLYAY